MKALCWEGVNKLAVEDVPDPEIRNDQDAIVRVRATTTCGSDLHLIGGYIPAMRAGDVIGHEFLGEIVETGPGVTKHKAGDRVVVASFIGCGRCWYCANGEWSLCDNSNTNPGLAQWAWGYETGGVYGYSHAMGGFRGSHAEYIRVPFADYGAFGVPEGVDDESAVFASDATPIWDAPWLNGRIRPAITWKWSETAEQMMADKMVASITQVLKEEGIPLERIGIDIYDPSAAAASTSRSPRPKATERSRMERSGSAGAVIGTSFADRRRRARLRR